MLFKRLTAHPWDSPPPPGADNMSTPSMVRPMRAFGDAIERSGCDICARPALYPQREALTFRRCDESGAFIYAPSNARGTTAMPSLRR